MQTFTWLLTALSLIGVVLNIRKRHECFLIWAGTNFCWVKQSMGIGRYLRGQHELCLFAVRGPSMMPEDHGVPSAVFYCMKGEHSRKPDYVTHYIERVSPAPRLEMFARGPRDGWDTWGNETDKYELPLFRS